MSKMKSLYVPSTLFEYKLKFELIFHFPPFLYERFNSKPNLSFVDKLMGVLTTIGTSTPLIFAYSPVSSIIVLIELVDF